MIVNVDSTCCKGCNICVSVCPKQVFALSQRRNSYGTTMPEAVKQKECIGCRICEKLCPDAAINVEE